MSLSLKINKEKEKKRVCGAKFLSIVYLCMHVYRSIGVLAFHRSMCLCVYLSTSQKAWCMCCTVMIRTEEILFKKAKGAEGGDVR